MTVRTLIVDDDVRVADIHKGYVERVEGFSVAGVANRGTEALRKILEDEPDLVLLDIYLPDLGGLEVCRRLRAANNLVDVIAVTAARDVDTVKGAVGLGVAQYLVKPFTFATFRDKLERYAAYRALTEKAGEADQTDIDAMLSELRAPAATPLPKGLSKETLELVARTLKQAGSSVGAAETAAKAGLSRVTARRYLEHMVQSQQVELELRYGGSGRPEHRYGWPAAAECRRGPPPERHRRPTRRARAARCGPACARRLRQTRPRPGTAARAPGEAPPSAPPGRPRSRRAERERRLEAAVAELGARLVVMSEQREDVERRRDRQRDGAQSERLPRRARRPSPGPGSSCSTSRTGATCASTSAARPRRRSPRTTERTPRPRAHRPARVARPLERGHHAAGEQRERTRGAFVEPPTDGLEVLAQPGRPGRVQADPGVGAEAELRQVLARAAGLGLEVVRALEQHALGARPPSARSRRGTRPRRPRRRRSPLPSAPVATDHGEERGAQRRHGLAWP